MSDRSAIEWTDATWNPIKARDIQTGKIGWHCVHVSEGCRHCYAESFNRRFGTGLDYKPVMTKNRVEIFVDAKTLGQPLRWQRPRKIFVDSMTDLFADFVTDGMIDQVFAVMALAGQHLFQILTKRPDRMRAYFAGLAADVAGRGDDAALCPARLEQAAVDVSGSPCAGGTLEDIPWPLPNVWLGVSAEDQTTAEERIPILLKTPAVVRFLSAEPLLGEIDLSNLDIDGESSMDALKPYGWADEWEAGWKGTEGTEVQSLEAFLEWYGLSEIPAGNMHPTLDWVIVGGESGNGSRPMAPAWALQIRDACAAAGVAFLFKQWGDHLPAEWDIADDDWSYTVDEVALDPADKELGDFGHRTPVDAGGESFVRVGKKAAGRHLDGVTHDAFPEPV